MQGIHTKFLGPTDTRDPRIVARCNAGRIVVPWNSNSEVFDNHAEAARQLCIKLGWTRKYYGSLYGASLPGDNGYAFVLVNDEAKRNLNTYGGFAPDILCPHGPHDIHRTTNDCAQCHNERKGAA